MVENKIVVITGGAGLLGFEFCKAIAEHGGTAIIGDVNEKYAKQKITKFTNNSAKKNIDFLKLDITSESSIKSVIDSVAKKYGHIDVWVNNAYPKINSFDQNIKREYGDSFFEVDVKKLCESVSINIGSYFLCSQLISKYFLKQGYGNIINISSIYGVDAPRFEIYDDTKMTMPVDYALNKSSMIHFTKYLAKYLKGKNIQVNTLSPGGVFNNQPESFVESYENFAINKGMLDKEDVNGTLLFLISDYSKYVNGQNIIVDDGWTL
jgi:NAD(P)-dependent dehydrogenase (short-subunit alcohol dehydrogenase family)